MATESHPRRILVVEDHKDIADALSLMLQMDGHEVEVAPTLVEAKRLGALNDYHVILCDVGLPDGEGTELPAVVKPLHPNTRLIAMTARGPGEVSATLAAGFDTLLLKPVSPEAIREYLA
jgi:two-component system, sensor histidine kinase